MTFEPLPIENAWRLKADQHEDDRGFFSRLWCASEFCERGLSSRLEQCSLSYNRRTGTIRGMHYQAPPREEAKVVRCIRGAIYDVLLDLRRGSPTFLQWCAQELTAANRLALYVPEGVAHGFQSLSDETEVMYLISEQYDPSLARGVRWDDPAFGIHWPLPATVLSARDRAYPDFRP
jgi:dTDP-4-dehydrorhamnose 3,5-epimerase